MVMAMHSRKHKAFGWSCQAVLLWGLSYVLDGDVFSSTSYWTKWTLQNLLMVMSGYAAFGVIIWLTTGKQALVVSSFANLANLIRSRIWPMTEIQALVV